MPKPEAAATVTVTADHGKISTAAADVAAAAAAIFAATVAVSGATAGGGGAPDHGGGSPRCRTREVRCPSPGGHLCEDARTRGRCAPSLTAAADPPWIGGHAAV